MGPRRSRLSYPGSYLRLTDFCITLLYTGYETSSEAAACLADSGDLQIATLYFAKVQGGLVFEFRRLVRLMDLYLYHSTLGSGVITK